MALDVYFRPDVAAILTGVALAQLQGTMSSACNVEYVRGVIEALRANCAAFSIPWPAVSGALKLNLRDTDLLEQVARLEG
jgi:hypothetical protein